MTEKSIQRLQFICETLPGLLSLIPESDFKFKPGPDKWSKQEILGHLIDSATNNHQRFIRIQFEARPKIIYDQDYWNRYNNYNHLKKEHVVQFWEMYNRHLIEVIKAIPPANLNRTCHTNEPEPVTLLWLIADYVQHMEHHLRQITNYE